MPMVARVAMAQTSEVVVVVELAVRTALVEMVQMGRPPVVALEAEEEEQMEVGLQALHSLAAVILGQMEVTL